jgi:hypothetical protein
MKVLNATTMARGCLPLAGFTFCHFHQQDHFAQYQRPNPGPREGVEVDRVLQREQLTPADIKIIAMKKNNTGGSISQNKPFKRPPTVSGGAIAV